MITLVEWVVIAVLLITLTAISFLSARYREQMFIQEREQWITERKDLLDRIQAPSFAEYTNKVVREKKAEQPQEEVKPIDFIS